MKYKIEWFENVTTATGKNYAKVTLKDEQGNDENVSIWSDFPGFNELRLGGEVEGYIKVNGQYKNLAPSSPSPRKPNMDRVMEKKANLIGEAQDRKERSIHAAQDRSAWMWAKTNASTLIANHIDFKFIPADQIAEQVIQLATKIYNGEPTEPNLNG